MEESELAAPRVSVSCDWQLLAKYGYANKDADIFMSLLENLCKAQFLFEVDMTKPYRCISASGRCNGSHGEMYDVSIVLHYPIAVGISLGISTPCAVQQFCLKQTRKNCRFEKMVNSLGDMREVLHRIAAIMECASEMFSKLHALRGENPFVALVASKDPKIRARRAQIIEAAEVAIRQIVPDTIKNFVPEGYQKYHFTEGRSPRYFGDVNLAK